jgi:hypothetical protein
MRQPIRFPTPLPTGDHQPVPQLTAPFNWRGALLGVVMAALTGLAGIVGSHFQLATHDELKAMHDDLTQRLIDQAQDNATAHTALWQQIARDHQQQAEAGEMGKPARTRKAHNGGQ